MDLEYAISVRRSMFRVFSSTRDPRSPLLARFPSLFCPPGNFYWDLAGSQVRILLTTRQDLRGPFTCILDLPPVLGRID